MLLFLLLTVLVCYVVYILVKKLPRFYKLYQSVEKLPGPPMESFLLGHPTYSVFLKVEDRPVMSLKLYKEHGGIYRLWQAWRPFVVVAEAEYAEVYFTSKNLGTKADTYKMLHDWLGDGLLTSNGELWQQHRKLITPAFHFSVLNSLCDKLTEKAKTLIDVLRENPEDSPVDVYQMMYLASLDCICESAMGIKIDALKNPKLDYIQAIANASNCILKRAFRPWYHIGAIFYNSPLGQQYISNLNKISELSRTAISNSKRKRDLQGKGSGETRQDGIEGKKKLAFMDLVLEAQESSSYQLSEDGLRDEVNTFMFAGHETTATSMSFTLHLLGSHPEIQERCYLELKEIFQGSDRSATVDDLRSMKYLEQVIKESLRLFPSAPTISRRVDADTQLGNYTVPEGTNIVMNLYTLHRDPKYFPNPEVFDPDRFSPDKCVSRHNFAYLPFAAGNRNCIGQKFAMMEMKVVLSTILRNFILESMTSRDELKTSFSLVLRSVKSIDVKFRPRISSKNLIVHQKSI